MEVEWAPAREPAAQRVWWDLLRPLAAEMQAGAAQLAVQTVAYQQAELPELFPDAATVEENRASTEASLRLLAQVIERGQDPRLVELPASTVAVVRSGAQRHVALAALVRFYRLGQEQVWRWLFTRITAVARDADEQATALDLVTGWLFASVDAAVTRAEQTYEVERVAWLRSAAAARAAAIEAILAGQERDQQRASRRLRYEVGRHRHHLGVIAWVESASDDDAQPALGEAVARFGRAVAAESNLIHPLSGLALAAWVSRAATFADTDLEIAGVDLPAQVRVAFGEPGQDLEGFRRTHIEASHARRVASLVGPRAKAFTRYRHIAVAALGTVDREQALTFVHRVLGPLAADDEATDRVAMTLSVYLDENRSRSRAGERLIVHPNTVSYRVRQAEEILGRTIDTDTLDLRVALALLPTVRGLSCC